MARVDMTRLRSAAIWQATGAFASDRALARMRAETGSDPLVQVDEVLVLGTDRPAGGDDEFLAIVKGTFASGEAMAAALASGTATRAQLAGREGASREGVTMVPVTGRTVLIGTAGAVDRSLALADRSGTVRSVKQEASFGDVTLSPGEVAIARYRRGEEPPDLRRFARSPIGSWRWLASVRTLDASLIAGAETRITATAELDSEAEAKRARRDITRTVRGFSRNAFLMLLGLARFLEPLRVSQEVSSVRLEYDLDAAGTGELLKLAERLEQIREMLGDDDAGDDGDADGDEPIELDPPLLKRRSTQAGEAGRGV